MRCVYCGNSESKVLDSRPVEDGKTIKRRRECLKCGKRFTTYERPEDFSLIVVKKDNSREVFDRNKILSGLHKACEKRYVTTTVLENMVTDIEKELTNKMQREVSSKLIGEMIMERLRDVDEVAYVRFASVYRKFEDIETFMDEIRAMVQNSQHEGCEQNKDTNKENKK
ncbi:MAG: transcriptional regulator NrdR [Bacillota bacterium]|jgi:transcriptional repressor NrdR